jgi:hypothetical protein
MTTVIFFHIVSLPNFKDKVVKRVKRNDTNNLLAKNVSSSTSMEIQEHAADPAIPEQGLNNKF